MEAKATGALPVEPGWQFEPKWDGFRCLAFRSGGEVDLRAKSGKPLGRYFPEMVQALAALPPDRFVLDGELAISVSGRPRPSPRSRRSTDWRPLRPGLVVEVRYDHVREEARPAVVRQMIHQP